jgi:putative FmdB family regulatory protein
MSDMPTYEYECEKCGFNFERFQSITEDPIKKCPKCDGSVRRLISAGAGVIFKGSGFYATDYRSESYKQAEKKEKSTDKSSDSKSSDSKSEKSDVKA